MAATTERNPTIVAPAPAVSLLERERELAQLAALVDAAAQGRGGVAFVRGPAGIGKTTLLEAARGRAVARGLRVLAARAGALERAWAFGLVHGLLGRALDAGERAELLRGAATLAAPFVDPAAEPRAGADPEFATVHGLYWLCADLSARRPLLLVADDAHWADAPSLRFLVHLARRATELPLALIVAARPPGPDDERELLAALAAESGFELSPAPLSEGAVGELTRRRLGEHATADLVAACQAASAGNPFLLHAALGALAREPDPARLASLAGARLAPELDRRLAALGPGARELARAVSVLGPGGSVRHARALAGLEVEPAARLLDALVEQEILRVEPLDFAHPLLRAAVHDAIPPGERGLLHAGAARALAADGAGADRLAPHLLAAPAAGEAWVASELAEAARRALAMGAAELAAEYLRRALAEPPPPDARPALLADLGAAEARLGRPEALERLRAARDATPPGSERARRGRALAWALVAPGRYGEAAETLVQAAEDARADRELALILAADFATVSRLQPGMSAAAESAGAGVESASLARAGERPGAAAAAGHSEPASGAGAGERPGAAAAAGHAEPASGAGAGERLPRVEGATPAERVVLASLAMHHVLRADDAATAAGLAARALAGGLVAEQGGDAISVYDAIYALLTADELDAAVAAADAALADARARGSRLGVARASAFRAQAHLRRGALADAESDARAALEVAADRPWEIVHIAAAVLAETLVERGRTEAARDALEPGEVPDTLMRNFGLWARARVRLALGEATAAAADLRELARREATVRGNNPGAFPHRSLVALAERGDDAPRLAQEELALARRWGAPTPVGRALRVLGLLEDDLEELADAVGVLASGPARVERARALCDLGAALARRGRRRDARQPLQEALELATRAGAAALAARAREELVATGARPRRPVRSGIDALTPGELRVARLAAAGATNREIAQALFVTTRTVEVHLTHAYRKLGIAGRAELARTLADA